MRWSGTVRDERGLLADDRDLVGELRRVVRPDLGPEPVLQRRDDPPAVGVVLRVRGGHHEHVERQAQHVAADLDVPLLHHVQHRDLDALGEVGQLVDGDDAPVPARDEAEVDRLRVPERAPLGDLHRVHVADEVRDARVRRRELLDVPLVAVAPGDREVVALLRCPPLARRRDRLERVLPELGPLDHRRPLVEQARPGCAGAASCPARARRAARCRARRSARARAAGRRCRRSRGCPARGRGPRGGPRGGWRGSRPAPTCAHAPKRGARRRLPQWDASSGRAYVRLRRMHPEFADG